MSRTHAARVRDHSYDLAPSHYPSPPAHTFTPAHAQPLPPPYGVCLECAGNNVHKTGNLKRGRRVVSRCKTCNAWI